MANPNGAVTQDMTVAARNLGEGQVQRRQLADDSRKLLEATADSLAAQYSKLAEDKSVNPKVREAALLYSAAEEQLQEEAIEDALDQGSRALELFREAGCKPGQQDALQLLCAAERIKRSPDFAVDKAQEELKAFQEIGDKRGQGCMLLSMAESKLAKALPNEAMYSVEEALPLLKEAGDTRLEANGHLLAARAELRRCQPEAAIKSAEAALSLSRAAQDRMGSVFSVAASEQS
eukprot:TRINITY_DN829_c0_g1_i2.p1 TRINITY_DN829_c0_g1~~TRINITY_DN829_c0_g1_i2.p1  ORF type:complete len:234 (+),score=74.75 TRINITY_DN829_c0_g1_i2:51-752(+)